MTLIEAGADVNVKKLWRTTPLIYSTDVIPNPEVAAILLQFGQK
jgi:hypothetical protein